MIISCWNIRGYNDSTKHGAVKHHINSNKIDVMALLETRVTPDKKEMVKNKWK